MKETVSGIVLSSDGVTPAWGARAALFPQLPKGAVPYSSEDWPQQLEVDARGRLRSTGRTDSDAEYTFARTKEAVNAVVVAWLPGVSGVVSAPYVKGRSVRLILPKPIALRGRVTVGGQSIASLSSRFLITARCQSLGRFNHLCRVEGTAQSDGSFTLPGLTPGTYQIQAARDGIWLSKSQTIVVGKVSVSNLIFDIGAVGAPVMVRLVDDGGAPIANKTIELHRPQGPLADDFWPKSLTTDSTGTLRLEGLEAGHQALTIPVNFYDDKPVEASFVVPAAGAEDVEVIVHIKL